ncbi:unnamed protein product [Calypogeia fissa]
MGPASAGVVVRQNFSSGSGAFLGSQDQHQVATKVTRGCIRELKYGRDLRKLSFAGMAVHRACKGKLCGGKRESLVDSRHKKLIRRTKYLNASGSLGLLRRCNFGFIFPLAHRRLLAPVVCNAHNFSATNHGQNGGVFEKHTDIPGAAAGGEKNLSDRADRSDVLYAKLLGILRVIRSFLPYGSWWDVGDERFDQESTTSITFLDAMMRLWVLISPDKLVIAMASTALVIAALSEISIPHFVAATIFSAQSGLTEQFYRNAKLLAAMSCTYGLFSGIRGGCFGVANQILVRRMREKLFTNLLNQDIVFFDTEAVGALTSRLGSDCQEVSRIIGKDLNVMFRNGLQGIGAFAYLMTLSWQLALTTFTICSLMWSIMRFYGSYQKGTAKAAQDSIALANEVAEETLSLARLVRTFGTEKEEVSRYSKWSQKLVQINLRQNVAYGFWTWSSNTLYNATQVVALLIGGGYVMAGLITAEQLTKFVLYSEWVVHSTWWVGDHWASLMQAIGASEKVFSLLDLPPSQQLVSKGRTLPLVKGRIQFNDIWFSYPARPQVPILRNVNLSIFPGEVVAVVGLSGSGKSTIVALLLRLYEPSRGQVMIDGVPLTDLDIRWFRRQLGVVSQEPRLFSMDVASNISYGCVNKTQAEIEKAAKQANAHDFIMALPDGYKTVVDNVRLSGGQKQRIAIARALLRDPAILILDEATSALDSESEHLVQKALDQAMHGDGKQRRTVLVIAHRLSTIRAANRIVVMRQGQIAEIGSHDELLRLNGDYARLTKRQVSSLSQGSS